jgi:preprotein translocase subunit SecB
MSFHAVEMTIHNFTHVRVVAVPSYNAEIECSTGPSIKSELSISPHESSATRFLANMRVQFNTQLDIAFPYAIDVGCIAELMSTELLPKKELLAAIANAAHEILLPSIREMVLNITARQPWGAFSLGFAELKPLQTNKAEKTQSEPEKPVRIRRKAKTA